MKFSIFVKNNKNFSDKNGGNRGKNRGREWFVFTLQPREQKRKESRRLLQHISQVFVTPLPILGWGLSLRNTIFALLIIYVWTQEMSINFCISFTLTTLWYEDLLICKFNLIFLFINIIIINKPRFCGKEIKRRGVEPEQHDGLCVWLNSKSKRHFQHNQDRTSCIRFCLNQHGLNRGRSNSLVAMALATVDSYSLLLPLFVSLVPENTKAKSESGEDNIHNNAKQTKRVKERRIYHDFLVIGLEGPEVEFVIVVFDSQICELQCVQKPTRRR